MALNTQPDLINRIIHLRYLIGFLGEKNQCNWWPTSFYEPSGFSFLQPVFSRTTPLAQYYGAVEAARRFHDENTALTSPGAVFWHACGHADTDAASAQARARARAAAPARAQARVARQAGPDDAAHALRDDL